MGQIKVMVPLVEPLGDFGRLTGVATIYARILLVFEGLSRRLVGYLQILPIYPLNICLGVHAVQQFALVSALDSQVVVVFTMQQWSRHCSSFASLYHRS
mmetsp:Transcript_28704/g.35558  ORF Transcript_28704/g.35558 Transcript_28704/m.35558 type:complete len:99 (-) Transcript_28704:31-327(-)